MNSENLGAPVGITLDRFIKRNQDDFPFATGELSQLLRDIGLAAKILQREIRRYTLLGIDGPLETQNVQGETQQKLDVIAHRRFVRAFKNGDMVAGIVSEEAEEIIQVNPNAQYLVALDPLDGSSNCDVNVSVGTVFSIYRRLSEAGTPLTVEDALQQGKKQVAAGYVLYGPSTLLVYSTGRGVNGFTFGPSIGEFFLSHPHITSPEKPSYYSVNDGYWSSYSDKICDAIAQWRKQGIKARYTGSLIADFHRNMLKGGVYLYPPTPECPEGKLRLLYEANALAFLAQQAGGSASSGTEDILEMVPSSLHQRTPLFIGDSNLLTDIL